MSLFDFFKKKNKPTDSEQAEDTQAKMDASIELVATEQGSHGDNWGGLIGFGFLQSTEGQLINEYMTLSSMMEPVLSKGNVDIHQAIFEKEMGNKDVGIRTLKSGKSLLSAYPYLRTSYTVPFEIKQIIEWAHMGNLEAEIKGGGRDTFGFGFFATDYAVNSDLYKSTPRLNIKVSAIGFVLDKSDLTEIDGKKVSEDFAAYMPNQDIPQPTYYDFIGVLIDFKAVNITDTNVGYLTKVKLINDDADPDFFTVDMFINKENVRIENLEKGMKITGVLWLQGEIEK